MKELKNTFRKNIKIVVVIIVLIVVMLLTVGGVYAATVLASSSVSYDNSSSSLSASNVQDALDELYNNSKISNRENIVEAYTYNESSYPCITGKEAYCERTDCYESKTIGSCPAGTIIYYKVNDLTVMPFHVIEDEGGVMKMQSQRNTIYTTNWINNTDYVKYNTDSTSCTSNTCVDEGPMTVLTALERATRSWINVNDQTYTMGTTVFETNKYTGCPQSSSTCTTNTYTLESRTSKVRMITVQEAYKLGCTQSPKSCPKWMYNYLYNSTDYDGTENDNTTDNEESGANNGGYWTMNTVAPSNYLWYINSGGYLNYMSSPTATYAGARAVVEITK